MEQAVPWSKSDKYLKHFTRAEMQFQLQTPAIYYIFCNKTGIRVFTYFVIFLTICSSDLRLTSLPIKIMTEMRDRGTIGFIGGPEDTCESEALVAAAWNLPLISYVSRNRSFKQFRIIALCVIHYVIKSTRHKFLEGEKQDALCPFHVVEFSK